MKKIYLDSSNQTNNIGVNGYVEGIAMNSLTDIIAEYIRIGGGDIEVYRNNINMSLYQTVSDANSKKVDRYLAIHSNAGGGRGTEIYHFPNSIEGYNFCKKIYDLVAPITAANDRGIKESNFYVLKNTDAVAGLIEIMFHDNAEDVADYLSKIHVIALAIAKGIYNEFGMTYKEQIQSNSILYRVMCGSFSKKINADNRVIELKNKGFDAVIMEYKK